MPLWLKISYTLFICVYLVLLMVAIPLVLYLPTHLVLKRLFN